MFHVNISYPSEEEELQIVKQTTSIHEVTLSPVLGREDVLRLQNLVRQVPIADHVVRYALRIARMTRVHGPSGQPEIVEKYVSWGAGPRASQYLVLGAKAKAILSGASHVMPEHIKAVALPVMRHRIVTNFNAEADGVTTDDIVNELLQQVKVDGSDAATSRRMDAVMR